MVNTNKLFDLYYAAEENEDTKPSTPVRAIPKSSRSTLATGHSSSKTTKTTKTTKTAKTAKTKRQIPARLKSFWDEEATTSQRSTMLLDITTDKLSPPISLKSEQLPICLQASSVIDSTLQKQTLQHQQRTFIEQTPKTSSLTVSYSQSSSQDYIYKEDQQEQQEDEKDQQTLFGLMTYQHLIYVVCLGALLAFVWSHFMDFMDVMGQQTETITHEPQLQPDSPYFPSSSFTITSTITTATLSPSISAVRIFVAHQHSNQLSFTLLRTRLFSR
jgi:hypothetical protein